MYHDYFFRSSLSVPAHLLKDASLPKDALTRCFKCGAPIDEHQAGAAIRHGDLEGLPAPSLEWSHTLYHDVLFSEKVDHKLPDAVSGTVADAAVPQPAGSSRRGGDHLLETGPMRIYAPTTISLITKKTPWFGLTARLGLLLERKWVDGFWRRYKDSLAADIHKVAFIGTPGTARPSPSTAFFVATSSPPKVMNKQQTKHRWRRSATWR